MKRTDCLPLTDLDFLRDIESANISQLEVIWPCEVRTYWKVELRGLVTAVQFMLSYLNGIIIIIGLILNTIAFLVLNGSHPNDNFSIYLRALAVSDNGALIFNYGVGLLRAHIPQVGRWYLDYWWLCDMHKVTVDLFFFTSAWLIVTLTWERLLVVRCPFGGMFHSTTGSACFRVVFLVVVLLLFTLSKIKFSGFEQDSVMGYQPCEDTEEIKETAIYLYTAVSIWLPLTLVVCGNMNLLFQIRKSVYNRSKLLGGWDSELTSDIHKMTRLLLLVSATYVIFLLPIGVVEMVEMNWEIEKSVKPSAGGPDKQLYIAWLKRKLLLKWIRGICFSFYQWNFACNFFLYCLSGDKFRTAVKEWLMGHCFIPSRRVVIKRHSPSTHSSKLQLTVNVVSSRVTNMSGETSFP
ncbi:uncharacterized protein [Anabrus simplex]|uniref:uncharacterized protein isoform X2 n=2 Tax=Anabrus simplex TaxID=316456 RepID=UPI0035A2C408